MPTPVGDAMTEIMDDLAARIARNREIAGVHYQSDTHAGGELAKTTFDVLKTVDSFQRLARAARNEWAGVEIGTDIAVPMPDSIATQVTKALLPKLRCTTESGQ
jgi:hypothetical protein